MNRILIVDDTVTVALSVKMILSRAGYEVESVMSAEEGLAILETSTFGLVLSDVMMPGMCGPEFVEQLKAGNRTAHIPVIMITTQSCQEMMDKCFAAGCVDYVTKPVSSRELLQKVKYHLSMPLFGSLFPANVMNP